MNAHIERAAHVDGPSILQLLQEAGLPIDGLAGHLNTAFVAREGGAILGCAAVEVYEEGALLRSVAVARSAQGRGLGRQLTEAAVTFARSMGLPALYLLTTTAEAYFPRFGFVRIARDQVPRGVQRSIEFRSACPSSAIVMEMGLNDTVRRS